MRIIRGKLKSRRFSAPKGFPSRPTTDYAKEGLFNILENKFSLVDLDILDLCAGTGNITLEFASRESGHITAVDQNFNCVKFIKNLVHELELEKEIDVFRADVRDFVKKTTKTFDLIFADPPYDSPIHAGLATTVFERSLLNKNGLLIIEHGRQTDLSSFPQYEQTKQYGNVYFSFLKNEISAAEE